MMNRCKKCAFQGKEEAFSPLELRIHDEYVTMYRCPACNKLRFVRFVFIKERNENVI
jgi:predicted RNA-binding Zn-ribbon protein involved in translation (DUF1610 family)